VSQGFFFTAPEPPELIAARFGGDELPDLLATT
jgi:hypothetical protein